MDPRFAILAAEYERRRSERRARLQEIRDRRARLRAPPSEASRPSVEEQSPEELLKSLLRDTAASPNEEDQST